MTLKQKIYVHYLTAVNDKIKWLQQVLADLKESGTNETKSTAGDKHETALAMLQIEQANTREQLKEALAQKAVLAKINPGLPATAIINGSLIKTNRGYFYLSIGLGKATIENIDVFALSPQSPVGLKLWGLTINDVAVINNSSYIIESIV